MGGDRGGGGIDSEAISNLIEATVSPNFRFYLYGIKTASKSNQNIETRRRREELFKQGLSSLLSNMDFKKKDLESIGRGIFFEGSLCFSSRPIPGLEPSKLPLYLVGSNKTDHPDCPSSDNGDFLQVMNVKGYKMPPELEYDAADIPGSNSPIVAALDGRCADCTTAFKDTSSLLSHCRESGHTPQSQFSDDERTRKGIKVENASKEIFLAFCNVALQRAMGERMARWVSFAYIPI